MKSRSKHEGELNKDTKETVVAHLDDESFKRSVKAHPFLLVDFLASWCGPCKAMAPVIEELAEKYAGRVFMGKIDIDENPKTADSYGVRSIPTLVLFKDGEEVDRIVGSVPKGTVEKAVNKAFSFDTHEEPNGTWKSNEECECTLAKDDDGTPERDHEPNGRETLRGQVEGAKEAVKLLRESKLQKVQDEDQREKDYEVERAKFMVLEKTRAAEKRRLGRGVLQRLEELKADPLFQEAFELYVQNAFDSCLVLYERNLSNPAEADPDNAWLVGRREVLDEFGLNRDGTLFFRNRVPIKHFAEAMCYYGSPNMGKKLLLKPESFTRANCVSLKEFYAFICSDGLQKRLAGQIERLTEVLKKKRER